MDSPIVIGSLIILGIVGLWWGTVRFVNRDANRARKERILTEDALKHIYHGEHHGHTVSLPSVAGTLQISLARTVDIIRRMQAAGLVRLQDGRLLLSDGGARYALQVIRAHRLWERYLADETGVAPEDWHARAEDREHSMTPEETDELERQLGHPRFDPHGDPIPTADGGVPDVPVVPLSNLEVGERAHVVHIEDEPEVIYAQLVAMGAYVGMVVRVAAKDHERMVLDVDGRAWHLAPVLAANLSIQRLQEPVEPVIEGSLHTLADVEPGEIVEVDRISPACRGIERRRLMDLGIVPGTRVEFERRGLSGGLSAYRVRETVIALREEQAAMISVKPIEELTS